MLHRHRSRRDDHRLQLPATPYRNKASRADGLLHQGKTRIAEITDGTSNTIAIGEDAGRDPRYASPYNEGILRRHPTSGPSSDSDPQWDRPNPGHSARRYWRWAEPDTSYGVSGQPNNKFRPMYEATPWLTHRPLTAGNNAGANDELFSYHPGGVNVLMGDGSVRFLRDTVNIVTLRGLVTLKGGEVISADSY